MTQGHSEAELLLRRTNMETSPSPNRPSHNSNDNPNDTSNDNPNAVSQANTHIPATFQATANSSTGIEHGPENPVKPTSHQPSPSGSSSSKSDEDTSGEDSSSPEYTPPRKSTSHKTQNKNIQDQPPAWLLTLKRDLEYSPTIPDSHERIRLGHRQDVTIQQ